ncbi:LGFP repeat-containing protein [Nannocystaceae bacterium ST9]
MPTLVVDYKLVSAGAISNPDGSLPGQVTNATQVAGPGTSALGQCDRALRFGPGAGLQTLISPGALRSDQFCVRALIRVGAPVTGRLNVIESNALPFGIFVESGVAPNAFNVVAAVQNGAVGWTTASTNNRRQLQVGVWYVLSLVYDLDTLAVMIDDTVLAVAAFPSGGLAAGTADRLFVGTWIDGARWPFVGDIAAIQVWSGIPEALENKLDQQRGAPEWFLTHKHAAIRPIMNFGAKTADLYLDSAIGSWLQPFEWGTIAYTVGHGVAFEMHGDIHGSWKADSALRAKLGPPASDELASPGVGARKNVFTHGTLYWSPPTGAIAVLGRISLDYQMIGEGRHAIGMPIAAEQAIAGGRVQAFQAGKMYLRDGGTNAFEVHGDILAKYESTGGPGRWGFPSTHESDVRNGNAVIGKFNQFDGCTIYWSGATGAHVIYGDIRARYLATGGPLGGLGFPTSSEADIPGAPPPARYNTFERGSILWFAGDIHVCYPFQFYFGRVDTKEEDRDIFDFDGQNELYFKVGVDVNGHTVFSRQLPDSGTYPSANIMNLDYRVPYEVVPNSPTLKVKLNFSIEELDQGELDWNGTIHLGDFSKELTMATAWGLRENAQGLFRSSNFGPWVNSVDWAVQPKLPPNTALDNWGVTNRGTPTIEWREFGAAFGDVDPDFEFDLGIIDDGLKALFYEAVVKGVAAGGNCFGMATEAIYASKQMSRLSRPLARFTNWNDVVDDFNVKHIYQVGADALWWFVGQFFSGNTHNPVGVFQSTWDFFTRGLDPVICLAQNYDFSGAPHCIWPIAWRNDRIPWEIDCFDPNRMQTKTCIYVDPRNNTFRYDNGRTYTGGEWDGGRLHYMPFSVLNHRQRTPVWDAILLALGGLIVLLGDDAQTESLTDEGGRQLDATKLTGRNVGELSGKLLPIRGITGDAPIRGELYLGVAPPRVVSPLLADLATSKAAAKIGLTTQVGQIPRATAIKPSKLAGLVDRTPTDLQDLRHALVGERNGRLGYYLKRPLAGTSITGTIAQGERVGVGVTKLDSPDNVLSLTADRARTFECTMSSRLGAGTDYVKLTLSNLSAQPGRTLELNVAPGLRALDVIGTAGPADVGVRLEGKIAGRAIQHVFQVRVDKGSRIGLPDLSALDRIKVGEIDNLRADVRKVQILRPK